MNTIVVGSGPSAPEVANADFERLTKVAVNNAWRVRQDFDHTVYPGDFPPDRRPPAEYAAMHVSNAEYEPMLNAAGGIVFCGATMAFVVGYWAAQSLQSDVIGFFALDMVYRGDKTHFYGRGTADPLRKNVTLQNLEAKSARLFLWALARGKLLVNCSCSPESRLVFPRIPLDRLQNYRLGSSSLRTDLVRRANDILAIERSAPFDPHRADYWFSIDTDEKRAFISKVDNLWAQQIPLIRAFDETLKAQVPEAAYSEPDAEGGGAHCLPTACILHMKQNNQMCHSPPLPL